MDSIKQRYLNLPNELSLASSDILFIASDVSKLALNLKHQGERFDANIFIESFQEKLSDGALIIPAYTDHLKNGDVFDHLKSKPSTGAISNKVMRRKDFNRSFDPLHSVFYWGKKSKEIKRINSESTLGKGSIFEFLHRNKAKMICLDVDFQNSLTFVHYVEEIKKVKYRKKYHWHFKIKCADSFEEKKTIFYTKKAGTVTKLDSFQEDAIKKGIVKEFYLEDSKILFFDFAEIYTFIEEYLNSGKKLYGFSFREWLKNNVKKVIKRK